MLLYIPASNQILTIAGHNRAPEGHRRILRTVEPGRRQAAYPALLLSWSTASSWPVHTPPPYRRLSAVIMSGWNAALRTAFHQEPIILWSCAIGAVGAPSLICSHDG